jgi:DNA-binding YbaB/EbfC family protein
LPYIDVLNPETIRRYPNFDFSTLNVTTMQLKDMAGMLKQMQEVQSKMEEIQKELGKKTVSAESGGGMVKVTANGRQELLTIEIEPDLLNKDDVEMLVDLIVAAVNKALKEAAKLAQDEMSQATGGILKDLKLPKDLGFNF